MQGQASFGSVSEFAGTIHPSSARLQGTSRRLGPAAWLEAHLREQRERMPAGPPARPRCSRRRSLWTWLPMWRRRSLKPSRYALSSLRASMLVHEP